MAVPAYYTRGETVMYYAVRVFVALVLLFLISPILAVMPLSFNSESFFTYPMPGYSLKWYEDFFFNPRWTGAVKMSLLVALATTVLATALGTLAARRRGTLVDRAIMALSVMGVSVPVFWVGLLLIQYVGGAGILPFQGRNGPIWSAAGFTSILLPAITLGAVFVGPVARMTRTSLLETLSADYVRTARGKGLAEFVVLRVHVLRNAVIPALGYAGFQLGFLIGGATVVELVFAYPGMGLLALNAAADRDLPVIEAYVVVVAILLIIVNAIVDFCSTVLDPRIGEVEL